MRKLFLLIAASILFAIPLAAQTTDRDQGIALYREGKFTEAVSFLRKATEANKSDGPAWRYLGAALVNLDETNEALKAFKQSGLDPATFGAEKQNYKPGLKVLNKRPASYTPQARELGIRGTITVMVEFRADGTIGFVFPLRTLAAGLTENVIEAAKGVRFEPAMLNGVPVTTIQLLSYSFDIH